MATLLVHPPSAAPTEAPITRGFAVPCLHCGEAGYVRVSLDDVSQFSCGNCDADYTADDVRSTLATWTKLLAWLDSAPPVE